MIKKIHMMGILGSGMAGVAMLAKKFGFEVSGCDLKLKGHSKKHLDGIDLLVVSPAVFYQNSKHPEFRAALKENKVITWQEFVGKYLMKDKKVIAVAGTHGKSTTSAMIAKILIDANFDPTVVIGANVPDWNGSTRFGKGKYFVIEADEFNDNFLNYCPDIAVINNIEFDHPDYFKNEKQLKMSFDNFTKKIKKNGILFTEKDSLKKRFNLKVFGEHNQKNANMAFLVGKALKINENEIIRSLESYSGIERRMEMVGVVKNTKIFDDYAHHPTAIKVTLKGLRSKFPNSRIWAIVEAHGYKRTNALLSKYKSVFDSADKVIIGPIFSARDKKIAGLNPEVIAGVSGHKDIKAANSIEDILILLEKEVIGGDIIIVMGAGLSNLWAKQILNRLKK